MNLDAMEYLLALWFVGDGKSDWMAAVYRAKGEKTWTLLYRFRYYEGKQVGDPFKDDDRKSWYEATMPETETPESIMAKIEILTTVISARYGHPVDILEIRGEPSTLFEKGKGRSWLHMKLEPRPSNPPEEQT